MAKVNRRNFLKIVSAGTCGSMIHNALRPSNGLLAYAMPPVIGAPAANPIMLVINFAGGADQHAMSPLFGGWWRDLNPTLSYAPNPNPAVPNANFAFPLNSEQGLHPSLTTLHTLWGEGSLAVVNMVGMLNNGVPTYTRAHDIDTAAKLTGYPMGSSAFGGWPARLLRRRHRSKNRRRPWRRARWPRRSGCPGRACASLPSCLP